MSWFKVDDKLHAHRKVRKAGKAAMGLWVLAGAYCMDNDSDGFITLEAMRAWGCTVRDAERLVEAGFWRATTFKGEDGWRFHDWAKFQPSAAVTAAKKAKEAEAGARGNHKRWHADRGITDPDCEYCYRVPDGPPDGDPDHLPESGGESPPIRPVPEPDPLPHESPSGDSSSGRALVIASRDDVERICDHLATRIEANGSKRPTVTAKWRTEARLLLDQDKRSEVDVHTAIDWCQADSFWRSNILSMPKLRAKYDQLRLAASRSNAPRKGDIDWEAAMSRAAAKTEGA